jgi:antitoxin (DNA-binding transcriptional repressor) of toxin-antitoxin stability system
MGSVHRVYQEPKLREALRGPRNSCKLVTTIMATSEVGVRELKLHAPALVRRASKGESIVITRYGKARAVLGPPESEPARESTRMPEWHEQERAFERMLPAIERRHRGRYVAVLGGRVVASDADPHLLFDRVWAKHRGRTFFIGRVGGPNPIVDMPGFDIE